MLAHASTDFRYVQCDIPAGVTVAQYRRSRPRRQSRWERLKSLAGGVASLSVPTPTAA